MLNLISSPRVAVALCACVVVFFALAARVPAQETRPAQGREGAPANAAPTPAPSPAATTTTAATATVDHDLSITANVTARELLFEVVPNPKVEFPGQPRRDTIWEAERTNLPAQVQPGVTYRDIGIRLKITSVFADIERIVAEALGEIPASDGGGQAPDPNPLPQTSEATPTSAAQTDAVTQEAAATHTPVSTPGVRGANASATPARRKNESRATVRRGRH